MHDPNAPMDDRLGPLEIIKTAIEDHFLHLALEEIGQPSHVAHREHVEAVTMRLQKTPTGAKLATALGVVNELMARRHETREETMIRLRQLVVPPADSLGTVLYMGMQGLYGTARFRHGTAEFVDEKVLPVLADALMVVK